MKEPQEKHVADLDPDPFSWLVLILSGISAAVPLAQFSFDRKKSNHDSRGRIRKAIREAREAAHNLLNSLQGVEDLLKSGEENSIENWRGIPFRVGSMSLFMDLNMAKEWHRNATVIVSRLHDSILDIMAESRISPQWKEASGRHNLDRQAGILKMSLDSFFARTSYEKTIDNMRISIANVESLLDSLSSAIDEIDRGPSRGGSAIEF